MVSGVARPVLPQLPPPSLHPTLLSPSVFPFYHHPSPPQCSSPLNYFPSQINSIMELPPFFFYYSFGAPPHATCALSVWPVKCSGKDGNSFLLSVCPVPSMTVFILDCLINVTRKFGIMIYAGLNDLCYSNMWVSNNFLCISPYIPH